MKKTIFKFLLTLSSLGIIGSIGAIELETASLFKGFLAAIFWIIIFTISLYQVDNK